MNIFKLNCEDEILEINQELHNNYNIADLDIFGNYCNVEDTIRQCNSNEIKSCVCMNKIRDIKNDIDLKILDGFYDGTSNELNALQHTKVSECLNSGHFLI